MTTSLAIEVIRTHQSVPTLITEDSVRAALKFVDLLDAKTPSPTVVVSDKGEIGFYWEQGDKVFVLVPETCATQLRYVVEFGSTRRQGQAPLATVIPTFVQEILDAFRPEYH